MRPSLQALRRFPRPPVRTLLLAALIAAGAIAAVAGLHQLELPRFIPRETLVAHEPGGRGDAAGRSRQLAPAAPPLSGTTLSVAVSSAWDRRVVRQATIDLEVADVEQAVARLVALAESLGGFVASTDTQTDAKGATRAMLIARVPAAEFARALAGVDGVGRITRRGIGGQDVSEELVDLDARLRNLQRHESQLLSFMGKAQKVADLVSLESELSRVRGEVEQTAGRLRFLKARTDLASLQVSVVRAPLLAPPDSQLARAIEQLKHAFAEAWLAALGWTVALAVLAAQLSPLAIPAVVGWAIYRRCASGRRRASERRWAARPPEPPAASASA